MHPFKKSFKDVQCATWYMIDYCEFATPRLSLQMCHVSSFQRFDKTCWRHFFCLPLPTRKLRNHFVECKPPFMSAFHKTADKITHFTPSRRVTLSSTRHQPFINVPYLCILIASSLCRKSLEINKATKDSVWEFACSLCEKFEFLRHLLTLS